MSYLNFILRNRRFLAFGVLMTLASSFGQTYFVSLFGADIRAEFGLSHGGFGFIYSVATVASAACLIWVGWLIDVMPLRRFALLVCAGLTAATFSLAFATSVPLLLLAVFALRLTGQGLMHHTAITGMVRRFTAGRGKAVAVAHLGMPLAEAVFPIMAVAIAVAIGWRSSWMLFGGALAVLLIPTIHWLLADQPRVRPAELVASTPKPSERPWTRADVWRDPRFYIVLPVVLAPSFIVTGLFFHQAHLAESKGWSLALLASAFIGYSAIQIATNVAVGPMIDRFGAVRLIPFMLLPLGCGLFLLSLADHPAIAYLYMAAAGVTVGVLSTTVAAMWAEVYGTAHLGAIRALTTSLTVFSSALSPVSMGWMIDHGVSMERLALMCLAFVMASSLAAPAAFRRPPTARPV